MRLTFEFGDRKDEAQVKQLLAACELPYADITPSHLQHFVILRDGAHLAGVAGLEPLGDVALLRSLAVPMRYRGQGFGSRLTHKAEAYARSQGVETLYLLTTTAEGFFAGRGYARIDRDTVPTAVQETTEFQSLCPASAVCMAKHPLG